MFAGPFVPGNENYGERVGSSFHREKPVLQLEQQTSSSRVEVPHSGGKERERLMLLISNAVTDVRSDVTTTL